MTSHNNIEEYEDKDENIVDNFDKLNEKYKISTDWIVK